MDWVNLALSGAVGALLWPFRSFPPVVGLGVVALFVAIAILLVFRATSDQAALTAVKRRMHAALFEIRLFNDDPHSMFRALLEITRQNLTYLRLSLVPTLWVIVPLLLLLVRLQAYYGYEGLVAGANTIVTVHLEDEAVPASGGAPRISLDAPSGLQVETPPVWIPSKRQVAWRIGAEQAGEYELIVSVDGKSVTKHVQVSDEVGWRAPERVKTGLWSQLMSPAELPIAADVPISSIHVKYPSREVKLFGWDTHWMIVLFTLSIFFTFALRNIFGVVL